MENDLIKIRSLKDIIIGIKGGGDLATGIAHRLFSAGFPCLFIMEAPFPTVLRRKAAFAAALYEKEMEVEGVAAVTAKNADQVPMIWNQGKIPVLPDPKWESLARIKPQVLVDAIMAKKNLGTRISHADLVIGLGPGFCAGQDVHLVIETLRGHDLGRIIRQGRALANTSRPEAVMGITADRLLRSPGQGEFISKVDIGDSVVQGQILGHVGEKPVLAKIPGMVRGLVHDGVSVTMDKKIGDIDPRSRPRYSYTISDKARALGGSVLEAVLGYLTR